MWIIGNYFEKYLMIAAQWRGGQATAPGRCEGMVNHAPPLHNYHYQVMLDSVGIRLPNHKVRDIMQALQQNEEVQGDYIQKNVFYQVLELQISE